MMNTLRDVMFAFAAASVMCGGCRDGECTVPATVPVMEAPFADVDLENLKRDGFAYGVKKAELTPLDYLEFDPTMFRLCVFTEGIPQLMLYPVTSPGLPWSTYYYKKKKIVSTVDADGKGVRRYVDLPQLEKCPPIEFDQRVDDLGENRCRITTSVAIRDDGAEAMTAWTALLVDGESAEKGELFLVSADGKRSRFEGKGLGVADPSRIEYVSRRPGAGFTVTFDAGTVDRAVVNKQANGIHCSLSLVKALNGKPFSFVLDCGAKERHVDGPGTVNGTDFRRYGAMDYAHYDVKGNILVNPSFESGARYWYTGLNGPRFIREGDARTGTRSLEVTKGVRTFSMPLKEKRDYVLSFYAKRRTSEKSAARVMFMHPYGFHPPSPPPESYYFTPVGEWKRFVYRFKSPYNLAAFAISGRDVLIDDVQLEEGTEPTPYAGNPYGLQLENDGEDPYFAEAGKPIGCRLVLRGESGAKGRLEIEVEDFFGRITHTATVAYALDSSGASRFPIPDSAFRYKGANVVKVRVVPKNGLAYTDYLRFSVFKYADGTAKNRHFHEYSSVSRHNRGQLDVPESIFRMMKVTGIAPRCRSIQDEKGVYPPEMAKAIVKRYTDIGGVTIGYVWADSVHSGFGTQLVNMLKERGFENPVKSPHLSDELLEALEEVASIIVKNAPWCDVWIGPDEISGSWRCARDKTGRSAARLLMAMHRGVKKGNPKARFICYSTFNNGEVARGEYKRFFDAVREIDPGFRFDAIDPHCYRRFYEDPMSDVDADWAKTFALLDSYGYTNMVAYSFGGGYCYPLLMECWNGISPWALTGVKDNFGRVHLPGYDLGWGERAAAAMQMRFNLAAYKYAPRLKSNTNWDPKILDGENPHAPNVGTAAQTEMLGNGTFLEDVRFHAGSRAYIFDDGAGNATAVFWKFTKDLDRGRERGETVSLALQGVDAKFYDMMANEVAPLSVAEGRTELPLSNFPVFVRVPLADAGKLATAFKESTVK